MQAGRMAVIGLAAAAMLAQSATAGPTLKGPEAAPLLEVKYSLADIPKKDRKRFWDVIDDLAILDALVEICENKRHRYDSRLRAKVRDCVDPSSLAKVQGYFNKRRAHYSRTATPYACSNKKFMNSLNRFRSAVDRGLVKLGNACNLCFFC